MGEHIFDKDSVSPRGVIYKDVGDGTDNFPVLEDRGTAHALDDSTGFSSSLSSVTWISIPRLMLS